MAVTKVTYTPTDPMAPIEMTWNDVKFRANIPVELDDIKHSYFVPRVKKWLDPVTQEPRSKAYEERVTMAEMARSNPSFTVEGSPPTQALRTGKAKPPKTPEEYRAHALAWILAAESIDDLARWNDEEALREKCGCGQDDQAYLQPHFDNKFKQLSDHERAA
jgi:hypothetical protein